MTDILLCPVFFALLVPTLQKPIADAVVLLCPVNAAQRIPAVQKPIAPLSGKRCPACPCLTKADC